MSGKMKRGIRTRLLGGIFIIIAASSTAGIIGQYSISRIEYQNRIGELVNELVYEVQESQASVLRFVLYGDEKHLDAAMLSAEKSANLAESARVMVLREENARILERLLTILEEYREVVLDYYGTVSFGGLNQNLSESNRQIILKQKALTVELIRNAVAIRDGVEAAVDEVSSGASVFIMVFLFAALIIGSITGLYFANDITSPLLKNIIVAQNLAAGKPDIPVGEERGDELGMLAQAFGRMAEKIMHDQWIRSAKDELDGVFRNVSDTYELADRFLRFMAKLADAQTGIFYYNDEEEKKLVPAAHTGLSGLNNPAVGAAALDSGLAGRAVAEREIIYFKGENSAPPFDYGFGTAVPMNYLAAPLYVKEKLSGVFLLGSFNGFDVLFQEFLEENRNNISVFFSSACDNSTIRILLEESGKQKDELLRINAELEGQSHLLKQSEAELQTQQEELRVTNEELEERTKALEAQRDAISVKNEQLEQAREEIENKADALEKASRYKSEFLANMSHELRTPLNSILILSELLSGNREGNLTEKQIKSAGAIHSSGTDLLMLINQILDLSKVEAGRIELQYEHVSFEMIRQELERIFSHMAEEKGLEFSLQLSEDLPESIITDHQRLQQVLRNLINNAFKFTEKGRVICRIQRNNEAAGGIEFSVSDNGIGIPRDKIESIFEAFRQADGSTSRKYGGTGLGLSISRELVRLLGGEIMVESEEGKGSRFWFSIPVEPLSEKAVLSVPPKSSGTPAPEVSEKLQSSGHCNDRKQPELLIIEDDPGFADIIAGQAEYYNFSVVKREDGESGLEYAVQNMPDAVVLDLGLPGLDGMEVLRRLKSEASTARIPVHVVSGMSRPGAPILEEAEGFISKPVRLSELSAIIKKLERIAENRLSRVLVVEDDPLQRSVLLELLEGCGLEVVTADTGASALQEISAGKFDSMVIDLGLADVSGFELLEKIKSSNDAAGVPVIIYTGKELAQDDEARLESLSDSIIIKGERSSERLLDELGLFLNRYSSVKSESYKEKIPPGVPGGLEGRRILLADDDIRNVFALSSVLEGYGLDVIAARDGQECLEKMDDSIDLVLMDIMMPRMDGFEAMRQIRVDETKHVPIIALTAKAMKGDRERCIRAGADDYLQKPVDTEKLLSMLRVWLHNDE